MSYPLYINGTDIILNQNVIASNSRDAYKTNGNITNLTISGSIYGGIGLGGAGGYFQDQNNISTTFGGPGGNGGNALIVNNSIDINQASKSMATRLEK